MLKIAIALAIIGTALAAGPVCGPSGQTCTEIDWAVYDADTGLCWAYASPCNFDCSRVDPDHMCWARYGWRFGTDAECANKPDWFDFAPACQPNGAGCNNSPPSGRTNSADYKCAAHIFDPNHNHCDFNDAARGDIQCKENPAVRGRVHETWLVCDGTADPNLFTNQNCGPTPPPPPVCENIPGWGSEALRTTLSPILAVDASGFVTTDVFSVSADVPQKFVVTQATLFSLSETAINNGPVGLDCYDRWSVTSVFGDIVNAGVLAREEDAAIIRFRGVLHIEMQETLEPIRGQPVTRDVISELPWEVTFPKQVEAHLENISVFKNPNNIAAIIYQEVDVDVNVPDAQATVRILSSLQWPFKGKNPVVSAEDPGFNNGISVVLKDECADANAGDIPNASPGDANACNQVWEISIDPPQDACELDGNYRLEFTADCQDSFIALTDCPLIKDDLGQSDNQIVIDFVLDSEYFCAQVVDNVDIAANLKAYKDHAHTVDASNFVLGQTIYFKATSSSGKATITCTEVSIIDIMFGPNSPMHQVYSGGADAGYVNSLVVERAAGPATEAWFQWLVTDPPFSPPVDGQIDYDVWVELDICFKDVSDPQLLLEDGESRKTVRYLLQNNGNQKTSNSVRMTLAAEDAEKSSASALVSTVALCAAVLGLVRA